MSNSFNQQLSQALKNVTATLQQTDFVQENDVRGAALALYYAHGQTEKTTSLFQGNLGDCEATGLKQYQAVTGLSTVLNIAKAAQAAALDAGNTTSGVSAAAVNFQTAATALTNLSANVASVLAVATSLDKGTKIQTLVRKADKATRRAAQLAEEASIISLNTTIEASQSRAAGVVAQTATVKSNMANLVKAIGATFEKQQQAVSDSMAGLADSISAEYEQAGIYQTAHVQDKGIDAARALLNSVINHDLTFEPVVESGTTPRTRQLVKAPVTDTQGTQFTLSFNAFPENDDTEEKIKDTHPQTGTPDKKTEEHARKKIISEYRLIIASADDAATFDVEVAKSVRQGNYQSIPPTDQSTYALHYFTSEYFSMNDKTPGEGDVVAFDFNGNAVVRGVPYVFYVYVVYTPEYQNDHNDTNGIISEPADSFTLQTLLPAVDAANNLELDFGTNNGTDTVKVWLRMNDSAMTLPNGENLADVSEFKVYLFNNNNRVAFDLNNQIEDETGELFDIEEKVRIAENRTQELQMKYNTSLALSSLPADELKALKEKLDESSKKLKELNVEYQKQLDKVETLITRKISNFIISEPILESIPDSNLLIAKPSDNGPAQTSADPSGSRHPSHWYLASNEKGDFTDNYGNPLVPGQYYSAVVLTAVKENAPLAKPLFANAMSGFSDPKAFGQAAPAGAAIAAAQ